VTPHEAAREDIARATWRRFCDGLEAIAPRHLLGPRPDFVNGEVPAEWFAIADAALTAAAPHIANAIREWADGAKRAYRGSGSAAEACQLAHDDATTITATVCGGEK
jgi:hypothetical protein